MIRPQQVLLSRTALIINRMWLVMTTLVNLASYTAMAYGFFRGLYYAYFNQSVEQFLWSVAMTIFAVYINLKNPNK